MPQDSHKHIKLEIVKEKPICASCCLQSLHFRLVIPNTFRLFLRLGNRFVWISFAFKWIILAI